MNGSSWGRVVGALAAPRPTFESVAARPSWGVALVVLLLTTLIVSVAAMPKLDMEQSIRQRMESQGADVGEEQIAQAVRMADTFKWVGAVVGVVASLVIYFLLALVFWLVFRLLGGDFSYPASLAVVTHGLLPLAVAGLLALPVVFARGSFTPEELQTGLIASNPAFFLDRDAAPALRTLLASLDVFKIWSAALLGLGYSIVARVRLGTALAAILGLWAVYVAGKIGVAMLLT